VVEAQADVTNASLPKVGDRIRVAMFHGGAWRPLVWLRVGADGSVYIGLLLGRPSYARSMSKPGAPTIEMKYADAIQHPAPSKGSRVSFKAVSGEIHLGDRVLQGRPLKGLDTRRQLCLLQFVHPGRYQPPAQKSSKEYDIGIADYPLDESRPMFGAVIVEPWTAAVPAPVSLPSMSKYCRVWVDFRGLKEAPDLRLHVLIGHGPQGPWPKLPAVLVTAAGGTSTSSSSTTTR
jgi:hypothetical protein